MHVCSEATRALLARSEQTVMEERAAWDEHRKAFMTESLAREHQAREATSQAVQTASSAMDVKDASLVRHLRSRWGRGRVDGKG